MFERVRGESYKDFNLQPSGSSNYNGSFARRQIAPKTFRQKAILKEKIAAKRYSGMEKGNSYHAHVSYPDCRIFLSYILYIRCKKKHNVSINFISQLFQKYLYKGCNFHSPSCGQKLNFHHALLGDRNLHISNFYSNFPTKNLQSCFNSLLSIPPLLALIRVLNIQSGNHFVSRRKFEYKTCRINIF